MLGLWAVFCFAAALYGSWLGYGGQAFAAALTAFCWFLLALLLFAARGVPDGFASRFGRVAGYVLAAATFTAYLIYALGTNAFSTLRAAGVALFIVLLTALAVSAGKRPAGSWQDFAILATVWVCVKFGPSHWLWPFPGGRLAYVLTVLLALNVALAAFVLLRRLDGIGYTIGWGHHWGFFVLGSFAVFACIAILLGQAIHFISFAPRWSEWKSLPFTAVAIFVFTAWPEEFLFRGLLQNMLSRSSKSDLAGWWSASILFGFSHVTNGGFPNWRYVLLASVAGFFYGWTWRKTGSIFASAIVHALVDTLWHFLFRTL
jgi:membrane protease YdiL (CAAX protease family)